jgi:thymidylate kinase
MPESITPVTPLTVPLADVFAVVGCDGTGKSTLTRDLLDCLRRQGRVERHYLGLVSGEMGDKIKDLPFVGVRLENDLHNKANRALDMEKKLPGIGTALIMYGMSLWRASLMLRVIWHSRRNVKVITDRYPQAEIPGFHYDGPGLTVNRTNNWLVSKLAAGEQRLYEWMAKHKPTLVIRLTISAEVAHSRKPDHDLAELRDKIVVMDRLRFNGARVIDIDATMPYPQMLKAALEAINQVHQGSPG